MFSCWHFLITSIFKSLYYQNDAQFLTARHFTNSKNSIISIGYVDFWAKIFSFLYPRTWNSITGIAIIKDIASYLFAFSLLTCMHLWSYVFYTDWFRICHHFAGHFLRVWISWIFSFENRLPICSSMLWKINWSYVYIFTKNYMLLWKLNILHIYRCK